MRQESRRYNRERAMQALFLIEFHYPKFFGRRTEDRLPKEKNYRVSEKEQENISLTLVKSGVRKKIKAVVSDSDNNHQDSCSDQLNDDVVSDTNNNQKNSCFDQINHNKVILDQANVSSINEINDSIMQFWKNFSDSDIGMPFFLLLTQGVLAHRQEIDQLIESFSSNWKINRMNLVDRNIMRIAVFEMLYCDDIPPQVSINEAVDIGKLYGTDESGPFINGILDSIHLSITHRK